MSHHTQREYLAEDLEQIRRFFPGATVVKALTTPFDLTRPPRGHKQKTGGRARATSRQHNITTRRGASLSVEMGHFAPERVARTAAVAARGGRAETSRAKSHPRRAKTTSGCLQGDLPGKLCLPARSRGAAERGEPLLYNGCVLTGGATP